jgi:hypothetical protein
MTAIIAFFFFFFVPNPLQPAQLTVPKACVTANARYRAKSELFNAQVASKFAQTFGRSVGEAFEPTPNECPRAMHF